MTSERASLISEAFGAVAGISHALDAFMRLLNQMQSAPTLWLVTALIISMHPTESGAHIMGRSQPITGVLREIFDNPAQMTRYSSDKPLIVKDAIIESADIYKSSINEANFTNTEIRDSDFRATSFGSANFTNSTITNSDFRFSKLREAVFHNVIINGVKFNSSSLRKAFFINCTIKNSDFTEISDSEITFASSSIENVTFYRASASITIKDSKVDTVKFRSMNTDGPGLPGYFDVQSTHGDWLVVSNSNFSRLTIRDSNLTSVSAGQITAADVELTGSTLQIGFDHARIGTLTASDTLGQSLGLVAANIGKAIIRNCRSGSRLGFSRLAFEELRISGCPATILILTGANGSKAFLQSSDFAQSIIKSLKTQTLSLEQVRFSGELDMRGALVDELLPHSVEIAPGTKVNSEGSNISF